MDNNEKNTEVSNDSKPCYIMVQVNFKNLEDSMQRYGQFAIPIITKYGGQMIAGSSTPMSLEGDWAGNWAAVLKFPSKEDALKFYQANDYQPFLDLRLNELQSESRVMIVEGM
jgi:uncharacterized protein (DUF1330 family)